MTRTLRMTALAMVSSLGLMLGSAGVAEAGSKGRRNTAIGLGAVALYGVVKKKPVVAGVAGGGAIYSYMSSRQKARGERNRRRSRASRRSYSRRYVNRSGYYGRR